MLDHEKDNYFILTGAMGAGKSTILQALMELEFTCIEEPARPIIAEQRSIDGDGIYDRDTKLFIKLMLSRSIYQFKQMQSCLKPVIFDRGIPDIMGYTNGAGLDLAHAKKAAKKYRYNDLVFFTPGWKEIYQTDDERKMSFDAANQFGDILREIYLNLEYKIIDVPFDAPEARAKFIVKEISKYFKEKNI